MFFWIFVSYFFVSNISLIYDKFTLKLNRFLRVLMIRMYYTIATVGYGDISPTSESSMIFTCVYAFFGIACLGIALGIIGSNLVEKEEKAVHMTEQLIKFEVLSTFDNTSSHHPSISLSGHNDQQPNHKSSSDKDDNDDNDEDGNQLVWWTRLILALSPLLILALLIGREAGWDFIETIYFLVITCTYHATILAFAQIRMSNHSLTTAVPSLHCNSLFKIKQLVLLDTVIMHRQQKKKS